MALFHSLMIGAMKKKLISFCIICIMCVFMIQPMNVKAYGEPTWQENFVNVVKTITGLNGISTGQNATMTGLSTDDFYSLLYNTNLTWNNYSGSASGEHTFKPSDLFTQSEWIQLCKTGQSQYTSFNGFNIADCFIDSGYVTDNGDSITVNTLPSLGSAKNLNKPIDGVEVITNFSGFNPYSSNSVYNTAYNIVKNDLQTRASNLIQVTGQGDSNKRTDFYAYEADFAFFRIYKNSSEYVLFLDTILNGTWNEMDASNIIKSSSSSTFNYRKDSPQNNQQVSNPVFPTEDIKNYTYNSYNIQYWAIGYSNSLQYYSNKPVVLASSSTAGRNYYYWLNGTPTGNTYNVSNITNLTIPKTEIINNNWEQAYNNYITDISNYYSTTDNITNQQLQEYIINNTTYNYITNNYITNNTTSGNESGNTDLSTSWLERIYNRITDIWNLLLGRGNTEDGTGYITGDGIKNAIDLYPSADLFPDVPIDKFISTAEDFTVDLLGQKISEIIIDTIPFCFIGILEGVAEALKADPKPPKWEIPFKIERLNIDESVTIDFTDPAWETVHTIWIVLFVIILVAFLAFISWKLIMLVSNVFT